MREMSYCNCFMASAAVPREHNATGKDIEATNQGTKDGDFYLHQYKVP